MAGVSQLYGEAGFTTTERVGGRPTLEVNGLLSGFTGEGSKTVLPARAMAKVSMRLVPGPADSFNTRSARGSVLLLGEILEAELVGLSQLVVLPLDDRL